MKRALTHPVMVAFGLANLYLLSLTGPFISNDHDLVYHLIGSASPIVIPIILYLILLTVLLASLLFLARRPGALRVIIWSAFLLALPSILLHTWSDFSGEDVADWLTWTIGIAALLSLLAIAIRWKQFQPVFQKVRPAAATILGFFAFIGMLIFGQLLWCASQTLLLNPAPVLHKTTAVQKASSHPRIIWLILDELSYQQIYEHRFPGLALPAFDRLAAQSTVFTHVVPAGEFTRYIVPTLFTGTPSNEIKVSARGHLLALHNPVTGRWVPFHPEQTVFQDAINAGYITGIAGWYNPYCRIMPQVLDHCFWTYRESTPANLSPNRSFVTDLLRPLHYLLLDVKHLFGHGPGAPSEEGRDIRQHSADYRNLIAAGDAQLADSSIDFLFLHMPVPHPFGFYDRRLKAFSTKHTSYLDNLALADAYLAHVRQLLEQKGEWDSTTLIVMGDHSWRTKMIWKDSASWTNEDEAASHGGEFDPRPAYLVKLPGQQTSASIDGSFDAVRTRALLDELIQRRLQTPADLQAWGAQTSRSVGFSRVF